MNPRLLLAASVLILYVSPSDASAVGNTTPAPMHASTVRPEHEVAGPHAVPKAQIPAQLPLPRPRAAANLAVDTSLGFLTLPYIGWHVVTSVFDHCNPDYTTDGKVCRFDGAVGYQSYGVDPSFSRGYAMSPRGSDYLYYDGHNGWDLGLNYENVLAAAEGTVRLAGSDPINPCFGQTIILDHPNGYSTRYAHLANIYVGPGAAVTRGQTIAQSGNTGCSSGPHLHFGVYITSSWTAVDPYGWTGAPGADPWPADPGNLWLIGTPEYPIPFPPIGVTAAPGPAAATVGWTPTFSGGLPVVSYTVMSSPGGITTTVPGTATSAVVTGLTNGTTYTFTVTAINGVGAGPASAPSNQVMAGGPTQVSLSPTSLTFGITEAGTSSQPQAVTVTDTGSGPLWVSAVSAGGDFSQTNTCSAIIAVGAGCTIQVTFTPSGSGGRTGSLSITDNGTGSPRTVGLSGPGATWTPPGSLGGSSSSSPDVSSWGAGRMDVFSRCPDGSLCHTWYDAGAGGWGSWQSLGGQLTSAPTAVSWGSGRIDVFARGANQGLWHLYFDGGAWSGWQDLGGMLASAPDVSSWGGRRLDVFAQCLDQSLCHKWFDGATWSGWESLGGPLTSAPAAASWGNGRIDVFGRGPDLALWHKWFDSTGWSGWQNLGGTLASGPDATSSGPGRLDIFAKCLDGSLCHTWYDSVRWNPWKSLAGQLNSDPGAISWSSGRMEVFFRGNDNAIWHKSLG